MSNNSGFENHLTQGAITLAKIFSIIVGLIGFFVIIGWVFDISFLKSIFPHFITMMVNTALLFILTSISLLLQIPTAHNNPKKILIAKLLGLIVFLISLLVSLEYIFGYDFHINQIIMQRIFHAAVYHPENNMVFTTAIAFIFTGLALILYDFKHFQIINQVFAFILGLLGLFTLIGLAYHLANKYQMDYGEAAIHTGINFILISLTLFFMRPNQGVMKFLIIGTETGKFARTALPIMIIIPIFLGYIRVLGENHHLYSKETGIEIFITVNIAIYILLIVFYAKKLILSEEKLHQAIENFNRSNKELEQFAYIASHDLQQPLRMVESYTQLIERRYLDKLDQDGRDFMGFVVDGVKKMQGLINNLLEYSRVTTRGKSFSQTDANKILQNVLNDFQEKIKEKNARITYDTLPIINADEIQIERVFQNLIGNAIKYSTKNPIIHIGVKDEMTQYTFSVSDNGIGIDPKYTDRVFVIFQRFVTEEQYPGNGMGLAICKKIIERHGGKIWFESKVDKGSIFYFSIPKTKE